MSDKKNKNTKPNTKTAKVAKTAKQDTKEKQEQPVDATPAVNASDIENAPMVETLSPVLGTLSASPEPSAAEVLDTQPAPAEPLRLPRGAFLALRKSGGMNFTTREVVVYPDGRVAYDARGVPQKEYNRLRRALNDGQIQSLRKMLDQTNFWNTEGGGNHNPDAFAYEFAARLGQRSNAFEVFEGSVPEKLNPLLERLSALLPRE